MLELLNETMRYDTWIADERTHVIKDTNIWPMIDQ